MRTRRFFLTIAVFASVLLAGTPTAYATPHSSHAKVAPADEYFGRLKLSILGIRNELHDLSVRAAFASEKPGDVLGSAAFVEDALRDWEKRYPRDPWLAKSVYELANLYGEIHSDEGRQHTQHTLKWLLSRYGNSPYAARVQMEVAIPAAAQVGRRP